MENMLVVISGQENRDTILDNFIDLKDRDTLSLVNADDSSLNQIVADSQNIVLWITAECVNKLCEVVKPFKSLNKRIINVFATPTELTKEQKTIIGRNKTVFKAVCDNVGEALNSILPTYEATVNESAEIHPTVAIPPTEHEEKTMMEKNEEALETSDQTEETDKTSMPSAKAPWIWFGITIVYDRLVTAGIINAWSDSIWFYVIGFSYLFLGFMCVKTSVQAIKVTKWGYLALLVSIFLALVCWTFFRRIIID